jgi:hypothetical protein
MFQHENEVRFIIDSDPKTNAANFPTIKFLETGLNYPVDLDCLIETIIIAPHTSAWVANAITGVFEPILKKPVVHSHLHQYPDVSVSPDLLKALGAKDAPADKSA